MVSLRGFFLAALILAIAVYLWFERNKFDREGIAFLRRTQSGIESIDGIARRFPRFWKHYGTAAAILGFISIFFSTVMISKVFINMLQTQSVANGPSLVLPGPVSQNQWNAGVSFIVPEFWIVGVAITMFSHELSHGIVARAENFDIESVGYGFLAVIPIGFVEPEGDQSLSEAADAAEPPWTGGTLLQRLKVLGAGSLANYLVAILFAGIALAVFTGTTMPTGVKYFANEGLPAAEANMSTGTVYEIEGKRVRYASDVMNISPEIQPGEKVQMWTSEGNFTVTAISRNGSENGYVGIIMPKDQTLFYKFQAMINGWHTVKPRYRSYKAGLEWTVSMLETVALLNFLIGIFNMLPLVPLDGGLMIDSIIRKYREKSLGIFYKFSLAGWALIISSIILAVTAGI